MNEDRAPIYSILASDEDLRELVAMFVDEMPERTGRFRRCFEDRDWPELQRVAHQLKGSAGGYGFASLSVAAAELEALVKTGRPEDRIAEAMERLIAMCLRATADPEPSETDNP